MLFRTNSLRGLASNLPVASQYIPLNPRVASGSRASATPSEARQEPTQLPTPWVRMLLRLPALRHGQDHPIFLLFSYVGSSTSLHHLHGVSNGDPAVLPSSPMPCASCHLRPRRLRPPGAVARPEGPSGPYLWFWYP